MLPFIQCHHTLGDADCGGFAKASCSSDCAGSWNAGSTKHKKQIQTLQSLFIGINN